MAIQRITSGIIADGAIVATDIGDGIVTTAKIADGNVTSAKIDTVANTKITGTITSQQIANSAITSEKIAVGAIPPSDNASALTTGTLPIERIEDGAVTSAKLANSSVTSDKLATGAAASNLGSYVTSVNGQTGAVTVSNTPPTTYAEVGTYLACFGRGYFSRTIGVYTAPGATTAGSNLYRGSGTGTGSVGTGITPIADSSQVTSLAFVSSEQQTSLSLSGTWRVMTWTVAATNYDSTTAAAGLFVRIS